MPSRLDCSPFDLLSPYPKLRSCFSENTTFSCSWSCGTWKTKAAKKRTTSVRCMSTCNPQAKTGKAAKILLTALYKLIHITSVFSSSHVQSLYDIENEVLPSYHNLHNRSLHVRSTICAFSVTVILNTDLETRETDMVQVLTVLEQYFNSVNIFSLCAGEIKLQERTRREVHPEMTLDKDTSFLLSWDFSTLLLSPKGIHLFSERQA